MMAMLRILSIEALLEGGRSAQYHRANRRRQTRPLGRPLAIPAVSKPSSVYIIVRVGSAADYVIAVDPNAVMTMAFPVAGHPYIIDSARPIARPVKIVGLIANFDVKRNGVCRRRDNAGGPEQNRE